MPKVVHTVTGNWFTHVFFCPACGCGHGINAKEGTGRPAWSFNGNLEKPTISPSIMVKSGDAKGPTLCHSFVKEGKIQFLDDCTHELKGKTVDLEEF